MSRRGRQGRLSDEDRRLWDEVAQQITPLGRAMPVEARLRGTSFAQDPVSTTGGAPPPATASDSKARTGQAAFPRSGPRKAGQSPAGPSAKPDHTLDRRTAARLKRGRQNPDARVDLHGMTQAQAHATLTRFLVDSHHKDRRLVLVITGKGRANDQTGPLPVPVGVLRHQVPHWLSMPPLREIVHRIAPAQQRHGGSGAYYVFLRRSR